MSIFTFIFWYYPTGLFRNADFTDTVHERGITVFLLVWAFFLLCGTFSYLLIAGLPSPEIAGGVFNLFFILMFAFCGVLAGPNDLPGFWIFMYRVNPLTYVVESFLVSSLANAPVECASNEIVSFTPANGTCEEYLSDYMSMAGGYLTGGSGSSTEECNYCPMSSTNTFLQGMNMSYDNRWRDFGFLWAYAIFNIAGAIFLYWLARVPKAKKVKKE